MSNFWDFKVWGLILVLAVLFLGLLAGHCIKRRVPWLKDSLTPTSVIGGAVLLIIVALYRLITGRVLFEEPIFDGNGSTILEILTYHCLALGFIASSLRKNGDKGDKKRAAEIFNTGVTTVSTYLIQALVGFGITILLAKAFSDFFPAAGILLPFGYGQGTGQALNYGTIYETEWGFQGGKSFGLTIAALGFLSAGIGGVIHLAHLKRKGIYKKRNSEFEILRYDEIQTEGEIPMQESLDKMTLQVGFVIISYLVAYLLMALLGSLLPSMKAVVYGFNFLFGVLSGILVKNVVNFLYKKNIIHRKYLNNFLLTRVSNFFFDIMVVAGIAAIRIEILEKYWGVMLGLGIIGAIITYLYNRLVVKTLFKEYKEEQFLMMYGMLTGTASTGIILLREIDPEFKTPAADNMVYQNFPAIVFGFPMMILATLAPKNPILTYILLAAFFVVMNIILFRSFIFRKHTNK